MSEQDNKLPSKVDVLSKIDNQMDQTDVINIMIAGFESNTRKAIASLEEQLKQAEKDKTQLFEDLIDLVLKSNTNEITHKYPFDPVDYKYELSKSGVSFAIDANGKTNHKAVLNYVLTKENGNSIPSRYPSYFSNTIPFPDYQKVMDATNAISELHNKIRTNRNELVNLASRERQLKAEVSLHRLQGNQEFMDLLNSDSIQNLIAAPIV